MQVTFQGTPTIPELLSPPLSPPGLQRGPQRSIAKASALKLITSFGNETAKSKYFSGDDGATPIAGGVTPIAESAISPGPSGEVTAFLRPNQRSTFNTPSSARGVGPGPFGRQRLPSIGEVHHDGTPRGLLKVTDLPTPPVDRLEHPRGHSREPSYSDNYTVGLAIGRAATASPMMMRDVHTRRDPPPPSPSPASMAALMEGHKLRNGSRTRIPSGVDMHLQYIDIGAGSDVTSPEQSSVASSSRYHWPSRRRGPASISSSLASTSTRSHRQRGPDTGGKSLDDYIHSIEAAKLRSRARSREDGRKTRESSSKPKKTRSRERSGDRGRASSRSYTPKAGKRSPRSPVPMSPQDLINLSTPRLLDSRLDDEVSVHDLVPLDPVTVRKSTSAIRHSSKTRASSRASSRAGRRHSPDRRPPALEIPRGRGSAREGSVARSPSSPLPMSANAQFYRDSDDEDEEYQKAARPQSKHRRGANRSTSRGARDLSPDRDRSRSRRRVATRERDSPENRTRTPAPSHPGAVSAGDLKQIKDERRLKKEAAARELEARRKSLARRPLAPAIPHPDQLSPTGSRASENAWNLPNISEVSRKDPIPRSQTADPLSTRETGQAASMFAPRAPALGLPATPKAMRLVMSTDPRGIPGVPPIPGSFVQKRSPPSSEANPSPKNPSPKKEPPPPLTLLPSTVYTPPSRPLIARCMSAPPEEPVAPAALQGGFVPAKSGLSRGLSLRKLSTPDVNEHAGVRTIDALLDGNSHARRASHDDYANRLPPPPPPPPMLKELAHLAMPPPPPPAPLPFAHGNKPIVYGGQASGTIEIVMDDGQTQPVPSVVPVAIPVNEATVPIIAAPAPPSSRGHHRGRSSIDNSIGARFSRATERMRSASRGRNSVASRTKSPEAMIIAPYESIPLPQGYQPRVEVAPYESIPPPPPMNFQARSEMRSPMQQHAPAHDFRTGLHESEMI